LDARVRKDLRRWIRRLHHELQITTIFVTHDQEEALEIADRVVVMNHSRIEQVGTPQEVYDAPVNAFVCQFLGSVNSVKGDAAGLTFVRPHDVEVLNSRNGAPSREAIVEYIHAAGAVARMDLRLKDTGELLEVEMPRSRHAELALKAGDCAFIKFRAVREYAPE
jgi:sulfate transport system ATP-binding protein